MLRIAVFFLLIANAVFFVWTQGYLAAFGFAPVLTSEPERLQAQIKPENVRLLNGSKDTSEATTVPAPAAATSATIEAAAASAASSAGDANPQTLDSPTAVSTLPAPESTVCWLAGGFTAEQANILRSALSETSLPRDAWQLNETQLGGRWIVFMGRYSLEQLDRKRAELRLMDIGFRTINPPLGPALALGTFSSEEAAQQGLRDVQRKGVRTARVVQERAESTAWTLRLPAITDAQRAVVSALGTALAGKKLQKCG